MTKELGQTYRLCESSGKVRERWVDVERIRSMRNVAESCLRFIVSKSKDIPKESPDWTFVFRDHYESLRGLIEAFLLFDGLEADNHQCKNACVCFRHPELGLEWDFLEEVRLKRNAINYRGQFLGYGEWIRFRKGFISHVMILREEINRKLKESKYR